MSYVWEAEGIQSELLPPSVTLDITDPAYYHAKSRTYPLAEVPDEVAKHAFRAAIARCGVDNAPTQLVETRQGFP